jgi:hypothetical protein
MVITCSRSVVNRVSTFRVMSVDFACKLKEFQVPCQQSKRSSHPVRMPTVPASSVWMTCSFHPDPFIISRRFLPTCICPDVSVARPDAFQFLNGFQILSKFQEREDQSTVWMMLYPIRTHVSLRQESQFKINHSDI